MFWSQSLSEFMLTAFLYILEKNIYFLYKFIHFIYLFLAALGLRCCTGFLQLRRAGATPPLWCAGFSLQWPLLLWSTGPRRAGLSSCGTWASVVGVHGL